MNVNLLGSLGLKTSSFNSLPVNELSGIAWDNDEQRLYAVSDEGLLYHLKLDVKNNQLENVKLIFAARLKNRNKQSLKGKYSDSEGLSVENGDNGVKGDSSLLISFENKPRIERYSTNGDFLKAVDIPTKLMRRKNYRNKNKALESVIFHPRHGILTAAEFPLKQNANTYQTIYSATGRTWRFIASPQQNSAVTGLETLPNGDVLILERAWKNELTPIVIKLRQLYLDNCNNEHICKTRLIASFSGAEGWYLDNFEGLAHYKNNQYLMISDDNQHPLQNTVLVFFEIKP